MKIKSVLIILLLFLINSSVPAFATQLPKQVRTFLTSQKRVPSIRFDGVITYNNDVMYLPVLPAYPLNVDSIKIVKTY